METAAKDSTKSSQRSIRQEEIVEAARQLYEEKGLSRTSVKNITERVGVARSLFYHYFADKEAVTSAVLDGYVDEYLEALQYWNLGRQRGNIEHALDGVVKILRLGVFEKDSFHEALTSKENTALYLDFLSRVVDRIASYILETTVRDYGALHEIRIDHIYETFNVLIFGIIAFLRFNPDVSDELLKDLIAQTLHMDRGCKLEGFTYDSSDKK